MDAIGTLLDLGLLWFLVVLFTDSTDADQSYREAWIVIIGVMAVGLVFAAVVGDWLASLFQVIALYFLVGWSCGTDRRTTLKICGWYLAVTLSFETAAYLLTGAPG